MMPTAKQTNKFRRFLPAAVLVLAVLVVVGGLAVLRPTQLQAQEEDELAPLREVITYLQSYFHAPVETEALVAGAIQGVLDSVADPYTRYLTPPELMTVLDDLEGYFNGVGIVITKENAQVVVVSPLAGTPAAAADIQPGDVILTVDGEPVADLQLNQVATMIRGPAGTAVTLLLQRRGSEPAAVTLIRERIHTPSIESEVLDGDVGYIHLIEFRSGVGEAIGIIRDQMVRQGVKYFILDLRNNPGGLLDEAIALAKVFVPEGPITHLSMVGTPTTTYTAETGSGGQPMAVLINKGSASASEIVAAAIAENNAGFLVGGQSFGKATVQTTVPLPRGGALQVTSGQYLTPNRNAIAGRGLTPDLVVAGADPLMPPDMEPLTGDWALRVGDRGLEVQGLQQRLTWLGYNMGEADGYFGPRTAAALTAFQRDRSLRATGRLDADTYARLKEALITRARGVVPAASLDDAVVAAAVAALRGGFQRP